MKKRNYIAEIWCIKVYCHFESKIVPIQWVKFVPRLPKMVSCHFFFSAMKIYRSVLVELHKLHIEQSRILFLYGFHADFDMESVLESTWNVNHVNMPQGLLHTVFILGMKKKCQHFFKCNMQFCVIFGLFSVILYMSFSYFFNFYRDDYAKTPENYAMTRACCILKTKYTTHIKKHHK